MSCGTAMCELCGHLYGVSWGNVSPTCPRCCGELKRAKKNGTLLPGHITWLIRLANADLLYEAIKAEKEHPASKIWK